MYGVSLLDVRHDKIIIASLCTGRHIEWGSGWLSPEALDGVNIFLALCNGQIGPEFALVCGFVVRGDECAETHHSRRIAAVSTVHPGAGLRCK